MSIEYLTQFSMALYRNPWGRIVLLSAYYLAIIFFLVTLYGQSDFAPPTFVYQGF